MGENQSENLLEIQVDHEQNSDAGNPFPNLTKLFKIDILGDSSTVNQTYRMIVAAENIKNNDDFEIEDDSSKDEGDEEEPDHFQQPQDVNGKYEGLISGQIEPIVEEDAEESKYFPTPQKEITSKLEGMKAIE